jgi:glycosyltransferase involved in cell wall biosynthesis
MIHVEIHHSFFSPVKSGMERRMQGFATELIRLGCEVTVCVPSDGIDDVETYEKRGYKIVRHPPLFSRKLGALLDPLIYARRLEKFLKRWRCDRRPDLVLSFNYIYAVAAKRAWRHVPVAYLPGSTVWDWYVWLYRRGSVAERFLLIPKGLAGLWIERDALKLADKTYVESPRLRERLLAFHPGLRAKIRLIVAPVDATRFRPSPEKRDRIRRELDVPERTKVILGVGRLDWNKNFSTLIQAVAQLKTIDWLLLIIGQGTQRERLLQLAKARRVADRVRFIDLHPEMDSVYAGADIFVHPALVESAGYVVLEALATGLPCVVSPPKYVAVSNELTEGINALFADPTNSCDWASKIDRLLGDSQLAENLGREARKFCERRESWAAMATFLLKEFGLSAPCLDNSAT